MAPLTAAERQRLCRARRNADPERKARYLQRQRERWKEKKMKKKTIAELSEIEQMHRRKLWRDQQQRIRLKKAALRQAEQGAAPETDPAPVSEPRLSRLEMTDSKRSFLPMCI